MPTICKASPVSRVLIVGERGNRWVYGGETYMGMQQCHIHCTRTYSLACAVAGVGVGVGVQHNDECVCAAK